MASERARRIEAALPEWGRSLYGSPKTEVSADVLQTWRSAPAEAERRFTIKVEKELVAGASKAQQKEADEAATLLLSLPWELIHDDRGFLFQGANGVRVRRSLPNRNPHPAVATRPPIRVLLVSPRPEDETSGYIDHRVGARPLVEALFALGDLAEFTILDPPTFPALEAELERTKENPYHVATSMAMASTTASSAWARCASKIPPIERSWNAAATSSSPPIRSRP
jgi:hypothetical protein